MGKRNAIDPETLTFGVEIECTMPIGTPVTLGDHYHGIQVPWLPDGWTAQSDGSLDSRGGRFGAEIVSPVLRGQAGLKQVAEVCEELRRRGAKVNASCGFHVHVGLPETTDAAVGRVVRIVARHEAALYAVTGTHTRESGPYCRPIKHHEKYRARFEKGQASAGRFSYHDERYFLLNVRNVDMGQRPAVEFRVFSGTVKAVKAVTFVRIALGLVHRGLAMARPAKWDAEQAYLRRGKGGGSQAVKVLLNELWNPSWDGGGRDRPVYGIGDADGLPALADCKAEAMRLAAKYDARQDAAESA